MIGHRDKKDSSGRIRGRYHVPFVEISENYEVKSIKSCNIIKSQIPAINMIYDIKKTRKLFSSNTSKEVRKLHDLAFMYLNYVSDRQDYEKNREKPKNSINITIEQVGSYLCCLAIELLLKSIMLKQNGNLKVNDKIVHSIKKNWDAIELEISLKHKYDNFINEVDLIYGNNGDKLRYNQDINSNDFSDYKFDYKVLLDNSKSLFNDISKEGI